MFTAAGVVRHAAARRQWVPTSTLLRLHPTPGRRSGTGVSTASQPRWCTVVRLV